MTKDETVLHVPQTCRVADISTWTRCFSLYVAVMANQKAELVAQMIAHLHTVMKVEQSLGGLAWLQYDWRTRKELYAAGAAEWERQDPWQLLICISHDSIVQDPFDVTPQDLRLRQPLAM